MKANVGNVDRALRISAGVVLIVLTLMNVIGPWGWLGIIPIVTGLTRFCPAYPLLGISTCKVAHEEPPAA